jgi:hypothetical protein
VQAYKSPWVWYFYRKSGWHWTQNTYATHVRKKRARMKVQLTEILKFEGMKVVLKYNKFVWKSDIVNEKY